MSNQNKNSAFQMIADIDGDFQDFFNVKMPESVPILPVRNLVLFPGVVSPILIGRESSKKLIRKAEKKGQIIGVLSQRDPDVETPLQDDLHEYGVYGRVVKQLTLPNGNITAIVQAMGRMRLNTLVKSLPYLEGEVEAVPDIEPEKNDREFKTAMDNLRELVGEYINVTEEIPDEASFAIKNISNDFMALNFVCCNMPFSMKEKMNLLTAETVKTRLFETMKIINREINLQNLKADIRNKTREDIDEQQRNYFLQQQIKNMQAEMGTGESMEKRDLIKKAENKRWPSEVAKTFYKEVDKLDNLNAQSPEFNVQLTYLQTLVSLPWGEYTKDDLNLQRAQKILDHDHYGMEKVKERILEYMAVLALRGDLKSPIICLYGPPGVGKTSLGKSIAAAMKRKYVRVSLGGLHDEAEIRGHRRTYIGAMPGRIIKSIQKAGSSNPVFILDEIDKVTQMTQNGDPASALLEVLDPEQNNAFHDNYLDVDYDLSKVLFIATANNLGTIPRPLLDRMEIIEVSGYITEEKIEIAKRHLIPRELENTGLNLSKPKPTFNKSAIEMIIERYTRESGVRQLEKQIDKALRKIAYKRQMEGTNDYQKITPNELEGLLGKPPFYRDIYQGNDYAGVVTGLAWTSVGGEILFIETSLSKGKGSKLTLTGNLGDVMKESAILALEYVKAHADLLNIDYRIFDNWNIHIHVPEGATPKDGPSAGITIATSIASALTQRKVRKNTAMTGEITLRGKVLPVGGIKEKILAAKRAGITDIVMCRENEKDINEIPDVYLKGVTFHYVENVQDVWDFALTKEIVKHPLDFSIKEEEKK
ncbi:endopeptidase La [Prevotella sp. lc2012]|uniref:endopeptidase La n=1 Tax=Prevotella sp. lc2012 TaxID=1761886 RepID=UPI0008980569|nr:endopeptidase La [Prevotella sp. lc2012]SEE03144.1 ATP-dependent Lon protease [Prevotella sp. lc2012]